MPTQFRLVTHDDQGDSGTRRYLTWLLNSPRPQSALWRGQRTQRGSSFSPFLVCVGGRFGQIVNWNDFETVRPQLHQQKIDGCIRPAFRPELRLQCFSRAVASITMRQINDVGHPSDPFLYAASALANRPLTGSLTISTNPLPCAGYAEN